MIKINETYRHEESGIQFDVKYQEPYGTNKRVLVVPSYGRMEQGFVFNRSDPKTIIKIGKALQEIGEFVSELK
jgi:hypothetical protein